MRLDFTYNQHILFEIPKYLKCINADSLDDTQVFLSIFGMLTHL